MTLIATVFALLSITNLVAAQSNANTINGQQVVRSNGNVAYSFTKEYIEGFQELFQTILMKETEEMELRDVRVQQKTDLGRLTSLISSVHLREIDLQESHFEIDFISNVSASEEAKCISDFELLFKVSGLNMVFDFEQWLEAESSYVVEEWGKGTFSV